MNIKALSFFLTILIALVPNLVFGLGLGGIKLDSTLDQPLKAKIEILGAKPQDIEGMEIQLASDAVYQRMGIEQNPLVENLKFAVSQDQEGRYFIDIHTPNILSEPFVNFLIEVNWKSGRLLREFTVLLDPPVLLDEEAPTVESPVAELPPSFTVTTTESEPAETLAELFTEETVEPGLASAEVEPAATEQATPAAETIDNVIADPVLAPASQEKAPLVYNVKKNEYLWNIAESLRPEDVSVEQMMLALQRQNPHAFYGNTVSHLKEGVVLRIDDSSVLHDISVDEAIAEISRQHQGWLSERKAKQASDAVAVESTNVDLEGSGKRQGQADSMATAPKEPRLELVTPLEESKAEKDAQTNVALQAAQERLNQLTVELAFANETVEAAKQENRELLSRLGSIEEQMSAMQSLIQLKDAEIQRMQSQTSTATAGSETLPSVTLHMGKEHAAESTVITQKDIHSRTMEDTVKRLMEDPVTIATIIFVGLFVALIAWVATRKSSTGDNEEVYEQKSIDELFPEDNVSAQRTMITERAEFPESENAIGLEPLTEFALENTEIVESSDELLDPAAQADVYLTYEKFDKAESLLLSAIDKAPEKQELKLKLLEVYAQKKDLDAFDNQADLLYAAIGGETANKLWLGACELAEQIGSNNPIFGAEEATSANTVTEEPLSDSTEVKVEEWQPEQVTEIAEQALPTAPQTEFEVGSSQPEITEFAASDVEAVQNEKDEVKIPQNSDAISDADLEKAMASFTDDAIHEEDDSVVEQDQALTEMLNGLQTTPSDKFFDEEHTLGDSRLFLLSDEIGTKLDLARAYIEMGDQEGAKDLLNEVMDEGDARQKDEAKELLELT